MEVISKVQSCAMQWQIMLVVPIQRSGRYLARIPGPAYPSWSKASRWSIRRTEAIAASSRGALNSSLTTCAVFRSYSFEARWEILGVNSCWPSSRTHSVRLCREKTLPIRKQKDMIRWTFWIVQYAFVTVPHINSRRANILTATRTAWSILTS